MSDKPTGDTGSDETPPDAVGEFRDQRAKILNEMGGAARLQRLHDRGELTIRDHIAELLDPGSFDEVGTFARSARAEDAASTPGDGKIGGHGTIDGKPVSVAGDDITVKRGSSSVVGSRKISAIFAHAARAGQPIVYFGATGGARLPDSLGSEGFSQVSVGTDLFRRNRRVPMVSVISGDSFGGSSFVAAASDLVVQIRGTCLAVTSPRVVEMATGEQVGMEELGGVDVHSRVTGQIDVAVDSPKEAYGAVRRLLSYFPPNAWTRAERSEARGSVEPDPELKSLVPDRRSRAYDMVKVLGRVLDEGSLQELAPGYGRSLIAALGRIDGYAVGVIASQPKFEAGAVGPEGCEKATRLLCLCDAFDIPVVFLQDVPGFFVGTGVEQAGMLKHAIRLQTALSLSEMPKLTVVLRKAFGLAYFTLGGNDTGVDAVYAWPGAEISFMDPPVAANVVAPDSVRDLPEDERKATMDQIVEAMASNTDPYGAAGIMNVDEIIDPAGTRAVLARALGRLEGRPFDPGRTRPLASWPTC